MRLAADILEVVNFVNRLIIFSLVLAEALQRPEIWRCSFGLIHHFHLKIGVSHLLLLGISINSKHRLAVNLRKLALKLKLCFL